jgi:hypothetical protein
MERWMGRQGKKIFDVVVPSIRIKADCKKPPLAKNPAFSQVPG